MVQMARGRAAYSLQSGDQQLQVAHASDIDIEVDIGVHESGRGDCRAEPVH